MLREKRRGTWRHPLKVLVGMKGFEPSASASRTLRSSQTEPHPDVQWLRIREDVYLCNKKNGTGPVGRDTASSIVFALFEEHKGTLPQQKTRLLVRRRTEPVPYRLNRLGIRRMVAADRKNVGFLCLF